ncbi:MAG: hypothetical protein LBU58_00595, partial [Clostridiales bacterium]|nr:hypothetical protein [Clostridiales bacterium]
MKNSVLEKLKNGQKPVGTFFSIGNATAAECLSFTGLDYIIIDCEHGLFGVETAAEILCSALRGGMSVFARVPDSSRASILKMLDIGAQGIIIPSVKTVDEVKKIVEYGKYHPL